MVVTIDTTTDLTGTTISVGDNPQYMAFDANTDTLYVSNTVDDTITSIDVNTNTVIQTISVGDFPRDIEYDSVNGRIWVVNYNADTISVLCT